MSEQHWVPEAGKPARIIDETLSAYGEVGMVTFKTARYCIVGMGTEFNPVVYFADLADPDAPFPDDDCADDPDCLGDTAAFTRDEQGDAP